MICVSTTSLVRTIPCSEISTCYTVYVYRAYLLNTFLIFNKNVNYKMLVVFDQNTVEY